jgi:hypothetical protein
MKTEYYSLGRHVSDNHVDKWLFVFLLFFFFYNEGLMLMVNELAAEQGPNYFKLAYATMVLLAFGSYILNVFGIKPFEPNTYIAVGADGLEFRTSMFKKRRLIKWNDFQLLKVKDLEFKFYSGEEPFAVLDLGWVPVNIANRVKSSILKQVELQSKKLEVA